MVHSMSCWQHSFRRVSDCSGCKASVLRLPLTTSSPTNVPSMDLSLGSRWEATNRMFLHFPHIPSSHNTHKKAPSGYRDRSWVHKSRKIVGTFQVRVSDLNVLNVLTTLISKRGALDEDPFLCHGTKAKPELLGIEEKPKKPRWTLAMSSIRCNPLGTVCLHAFFRTVEDHMAKFVPKS